MWITVFRSTLIASLTDTRFYRWLRTQKLRFSWLFWFTAYILVILPLVTLQVWWRWLPVWDAQLDKTFQELETRFPYDLELSWDTRRLSFNPVQPVTLPYPAAVTVPRSGEYPYTLAYLTPNEQPPWEQSNLPSTWVVITPQTAWIYDSTQTWSQLSLSELPGMDQAWVLNKQTLPEWMTAIRREAAALSFQLRWLLPLVLVIGLMLARLWTALIVAILMSVLTRFNHWPWSFRQLWQVMLHLMVAAEITAQVASLLYQDLPFQIFSLVLWLGSGYIILSSLRRPVSV